MRYTPKFVCLQQNYFNCNLSAVNLVDVCRFSLTPFYAGSMFIHMFKHKTTSYPVRFSDQTLEGLRKLAKIDYNTISNLIRKFVEEGLTARGVKLGK